VLVLTVLVFNVIGDGSRDAFASLHCSHSLA
jgi:hypothetical protein